jgi:two-component system sensor kinase FixL
VKPISSEEGAVRSSPDIVGTFSLSRLSSLASSGAVAGAFLATYVALEWVSFLHEYKELPITPWNPGLGVVFALIVLAGFPGGFVLFIGIVIAEIFVLQSQREWLVVVAIGAIISLTYTFTAAVARRYLRLNLELSHLRDVLLLLAAGLMGAVIVAVLLTVLLIAAGQIEIGDVLLASVPLLVGDIIGIAVISPLLLRIAFRRREITLGRLLSFAPEAVLHVVVIGAALWAIIGSQSVYGFRLFYLLFVPVMVAAVRHGLDGACLSLAVAQLGLMGLLQSYGYDARTFTEFQTLMLVLTATGLIVGVVVSERQNSDRLAREAEARLREKEAEAAQAARFNLVSSMASALTHEINQPMTAARALARSAQHILRTPGGDLTRADGNLTTMIAEIDHASGVIRNMRDFLRRGRPHVSTIDIRSMLEEALTLVRVEALGNQIHIELDTFGDLPPVHGDRVQLQQVILNLIRNAIESIVGARQMDGRIRITARRLDAPQRIEIGVLDNGSGIGDDLAERLFHPLTTSKHEGLGLGLPICVSIVESHGGRVWLHARQAGATEFRFSLPLEQSQAM